MLSTTQTQDIRSAIIYYMHYMISVNNPRYKDYEVILQLLEKRKEENDCNYERAGSTEYVGD